MPADIRDATQRARKQFYNSVVWLRTRAAKLRRDPLCQRHKLLGQAVEALHVDHWQSLENGGHPTADDNLVSLCHEHHSEKTMAERNGAPFFEVAPSTPRTLSIA